MKQSLPRLVATVLATLLVVAVSVGAGHATTHEHDGDCAVCVLAHHAPAVAASDAPVPAPRQRVEVAAIVVDEPTLSAVRVTRGGRAPPTTPSVSSSRDA